MAKDLCINEYLVLMRSVPLNYESIIVFPGELDAVDMLIVEKLRRPSAIEQVMYVQQSAFDMHQNGRNSAEN